MWVHASAETLQRAAALLEASDDPALRQLGRDWRARYDERDDPDDAAFAAACAEKYRFEGPEDGSIDFDSDPVVSRSDDGAYVLAWLWVDNDEAGIAEDEDEDEEDEV